MHKFEYTDIDIATATPDQIRAEIAKMENLSKDWKNEEQAIKIFLNSVYGGLANKYMICYSRDLAESITHQGQNFIKYAMKVIDDYFHNKWTTDHELHEKMGLTVIRPVLKTLCIAGDTDSNYVTFKEVIDSCDWKGTPKEFILAINEHRITKYLHNEFEMYARRTGTTNYQDFELENIAETCIWLAKKKYMLNLVWQDGIDIEPLTQITPKGIEIVQASTSAFAKDKLKELIKFIFTKGKKIELRDIINILKKYKEEFKMSEPDKISKGSKINNYSKFVLNDTTKLEFASKTPAQVRAAGVYNHMLNGNQKYKQKYEMIKNGDKAKFYAVKTKTTMEEAVFAFLPGSYPIEFAPPIDYDEQFAKQLIDPLNRIVVAMGFQEISHNLYVANALF